jgi:hypothetical protein
MPTTSNQPDSSFPTLLRIIVFFGKLFGYIWIPEQHVRVIYKMSRYAGARAPNRWGLIPFSDFTETLGPQIYIGGNIRDFTFNNILTKDIIPVTLHVNAIVSYDPRRAPDIARVLTKYPPETSVGIAQSYLQWVLLGTISKYDSPQLAQANIKVQIEAEVTGAVNKEMEFLGIQVHDHAHIMGVELPTRVMQRHEELAQQRASILAARQVDSTELRSTWLMNALEKAAGSGSGGFFVNFNELLQSYPERSAAGPPAQIIDQLPESRSLLGDSAATSPVTDIGLGTPSLDDSRL